MGGLGRRARWAAAAACVSLTAAAPAHGATAARIIRSLNEQRAENGIPAGVRETPAWSRACAAHIRWMVLNREVSHYEQPGTPGYTRRGAWAGANAVLAVSGFGFDFSTPADNPYLQAPYHLAQLLNPRLSVMGASERDGADCETTFPGYRRTPPRRDRIYTYPGDGATIPWFETPEEIGGVPGDQVGLPMGRTTGPNLIAFGEAARRGTPLYVAGHASLQDTVGHAVAVRTVTASNATVGGLAFLIPVAPLKPATTYHARIAFSRSGLGPQPWLTKQWTFTTTGLVTGPSAVRLEVTRDGSNVVAHPVALDPAYRGRSATLTTTWQFSGGGSSSTSQTVIGEYSSSQIVSGVQRIDFVLHVHRFKIGATIFAPFDLHQTFTP